MLGQILIFSDFLVKGKIGTPFNRNSDPNLDRTVYSLMMADILAALRGMSNFASIPIIAALFDGRVSTMNTRI
jgi:hypothetical protein